MKTLDKFAAIFIFAAVFLLAGITISAQGNFEVKAVKVRLYDNTKNSLIDKLPNPYGEGLDIFLSVQLKQDSRTENTFLITVEGAGKGRENEAEGTVEDYKIKASKEIKLYWDDAIYIPFVLEFPCTEKAEYTITVVQKNTGKKTTKTVKSPYSFCYMN